MREDILSGISPVFDYKIVLQIVSQIINILYNAHWKEISNMLPIFLSNILVLFKASKNHTTKYILKLCIMIMQ